MGLVNLVEGFRVLGLRPPAAVSPDISLEEIARKITNPNIARALGARRSIPLIEQAEWCVNLLDSFSESGNWEYLARAQAFYDQLLLQLPTIAHERITTAMAAIFNWFSFEQLIAERIKAEEQFADEELGEYLLRRGADSLLYGTIIREVDGIHHPGLVSGLRVRQALWDLADDFEDLEQDRWSVGANIVLLAGLDTNRLLDLAAGLYAQGRKITNTLPPLFKAIGREYLRVWKTLQVMR